MQGYDKNDALAFIQKTVDTKSFRDLAPSLDGYLRQAQELDLRYMQASGALDSEGYTGEGYYDEDDALEYIVEEIAKVRGLSDEQTVLVAGLVDAYLQAQDAYLRKMGLVSDD